MADRKTNIEAHTATGGQEIEVEKQQRERKEDEIIEVGYREYVCVIWCH